MSLRDQLSSLADPIDESEDGQGTITFTLEGTKSSNAEIHCGHYELLSWIINILNICQRITKNMDLDDHDRAKILLHWMDDLGDIKNDWFPMKDDDDDDE